MRILCRTFFDCSCTGTTGHFRVSQLSYQDNVGQTIDNLQAWTRSRNQQRNFESILQIISLRAQPEIVSRPVCDNGMWKFEFEVETLGVYSSNEDVDSTDQLLAECNGTPMIVGLDENSNVEPCLVSSGPDQNIWFETINI
jgi:hypothetical protein